MNDLLQKICLTLRYGIPKNKGTIYDLRAQNFQQLVPPIFFLSTGRCGTKWFSELLQSKHKFIVEHNPEPDLGVQGKFVYELQQKFGMLNAEVIRYMQELFLAGREEQLRFSYKTEKRYIETNNHITFFLPALVELFPQAKFVHLYRHPGEFVRSAIRRNYYMNNDSQILKRIVPVQDSEFTVPWEQWSPLQKSSWLWNETNQYIERFKKQISEDRIFNFNFNELSVSSVSRLMEWLNIKVTNKSIVKRLNSKVNVQKKGDFKPYNQWNESNKTELTKICSKLSDVYNYHL